MISREVAERLWARVDKSPGQGPNGDCWCWLGAIRKDNHYPTEISIFGKRYRPHHLALEIDGRVRSNPDLHALHSCDHKICVRPDHLRWGTHLENMRDHLERRKPSRLWLMPDVVRAIRASTDRNFEIARQFGVTQACVHNIRNRVSHKHVE